MPWMVARMSGGLLEVRMRIAEKPPPRTQTTPPPTSRPSLLVGSGSTKASTIMVMPAALIPSATQAPMISLRERRECLAICRSVC